MKQNLFVKQLLVVLLAIVGTMPMLGESVNFTMGSDKDVTSNSGATKSGITITATDGTSTTNNWGGTTYVRLQAGGTFVITPSAITITSIVLNCTSGYEKTWSASTGSAPVVNTTAHTVTWAGSTNSAITLTNTASAQARVSSIDVTYTSGSTKTSLSLPTNLSSSNVTANGATLSWYAVANASSYTVKIGSTEYANISTNSYSATGLTASTQYTWTVKAIGDDVNYTSSDYAANVNFTTSAAAKYTVTWTVEGATYFTTTEVVSGSKVTTLPKAPTSSCDGTFAGWVKSDNGVVGQKPGDEYKTDPTPFTDVAGSPAITGDTEFVAVFKKEL